jgi:hypothetical protein
VVPAEAGSTLPGGRRERVVDGMKVLEVSTVADALSLLRLHEGLRAVD